MGVRQGRMEYAVVSGVVVPFIIHVLCLYSRAKDMPKIQLFVFNGFFQNKYISPIKMSYKLFIFYRKKDAKYVIYQSKL